MERVLMLLVAGEVVGDPLEEVEGAASSPSRYLYRRRPLYPRCTCTLASLFNLVSKNSQ